MRRTTRTSEDLQRLAAVARGDAAADLYLEGGRILNVYSGEVLEGNVAVARGRIAYVGGRRTMIGAHTRVLDVRDRILVPGYIDPHAHPVALYNPVTLGSAVLPMGTTAIIADTLYVLAYAVPDRMVQFLEHLSSLPVRYYWFLRLHAQAHSPREADLFSRDRLRPLLALDTVRTVGEVTRWSALYAGDTDLIGKIADALEAGRRVEGHAPGVSSERLQALVAAGISSDHEAITADQALDRLRAGLYVMLRHSSLRRDLPALASIASASRAFSGRLMLTPDGPDPTFVADEGYMDRLIAVAIAAGVHPIAAYQMATLNVATYYGLDEELGGIAPGRRADINVLHDLRAPRPFLVIAGGEVAAEEGRLLQKFPEPDWSGVFPRPYAPTWEPRPDLFRVSPGSAPTMHLENAVITRRRDVSIEDRRLPAGVLVVALFDPRGRWMSRALLSGFAERVGGLASSYVIAGALLVIGQDEEDMARAARRVLELGGGIVMVERRERLFELPLPIAGMMSPAPLPVVADSVRRLTALLRERGYNHEDVLYSLLFLSFDSLPDLRLTYNGLWDVKAQQVVAPRLDLA